MAETGGIVVFTGRPASASTRETIEALVRAFPEHRFLVLQGGRRRTLKGYLRGKWRRLKREPLSYPLELLGQAAARFRRRPRRGPAGAPRVPRLEEIADLVSFDDIHSPEALSAVRSFAPRLGISVGAPILRTELFGIPELGTVNLHKSLLPEYRGMPPGFWELHDGAPSTGASVHWMEASLDTGAIIAQRELPVPRFVSRPGLAALLDQLGIQVLVDAVGAVLAGRGEGRPQTPPRTPTRSRPAFLVARRVERKLERARRGPPAGPRAIAKWCALQAYVRLWAPLRNVVRRLRGRCHVAVLLYHRVSESRQDAITVGIGQFQEQLEMLRRHFDVVSLEEFLAARGRPRRRPAVVITFDDGYADNLLAARLLRRVGLPAAFFVSTRIIGTEKSFPHDRRDGFHEPALSWDAVRTMAEWGFTVSNHTATHADMGAVPTADALAEIAVARDDLVEQVGDRAASTLFAYPYGRRGNITPAVREGLADLGVTHCLAAYGGVNGLDFDALDVRRQGVDCRFTLLALRAAAEGWSVRGAADKEAPAGGKVCVPGQPMTR